MISKLFTTTNGTISNRALDSYYFSFHCGAVALLAGLFFTINFYTHFSPLLQQVRKERIPQKSQNVADTKSHRQLQTCIQTSIPCKKTSPLLTLTAISELAGVKIMERNYPNSVCLYFCCSERTKGKWELSILAWTRNW